MKKVLLAVMLAAAVVSANTAYAQNTTPTVGACSTLTTNGLKGLSNCFLGILSNLTVLLMAAAVVYIIYGAFEMIRSEEKRESGRQTVVYGIIGLFVMVSVWGFVRILDNTFQLSQSYNNGPITPPTLVKPAP